MTATNYLRNEIADHVYRNSAYSSPPAIYIKMHTGDPGLDALNNAAAETTRQPLTFNPPSGGVVTAAGSPVATWTSVAASETWSHFSLWDAATGGNPLNVDALASSVGVTVGENVQLNSATVAVT